VGYPLGDRVNLLEENDGSIDISELEGGHSDYWHGYTLNRASESSMNKVGQFVSNVTPGACGPMGRGLSNLSDISLTRNGKGVVVLTGTSPDGNNLSADLDPSHGYVATEIRDIRPNGFEIKLSRPIRSLGGPWIETRAVETEYGGWLLQTNVISAKFGTPPVKIDDTFPPRSFITDCRLSQIELIDYKGPGPISAEKLLVTSQAKLDEKVKMDQVQVNAETIQAWQALGKVVGLLLLGLIFLAGVVHILLGRARPS